MHAWSTFETPWGFAGLVWSEKGVRSVLLPEKNAALMRKKLRASHGGSETPLARAPASIIRTSALFTRHFLTGNESFHDIPVDLSAAPTFHREVYQVARTIKPGRLVTYKELATLTGRAGGSRAVGTAMARNPLPLIVPCHRIVASAGGLGGFTAPGGTLTKLKLLSVEMSRGVPESKDWQQVLAWGTRFLAESDPELAKLIKRVGPCQLTPTRSGSVFATLARSIVYQQLSGKAAATIFGRVKDLFPGSAFPKPKAVLAMPDERLRSAGLSGSKLRAFKDLAAKVDGALIPDAAALADLSDADAIEALTEVRGVGPWTVEMLLMFDQGRFDVWPVSDYGVRKGFAQVYRKRTLPTPEALRKAGEKWRPFRSLAAWYFWRALELESPL